MAQKKLQVFVSSTYTDMKAERQAAVEAILQAGHIPAGMELFASGDESQWETIRRWIDDSDVFMLILGGRYGSLEPKTGKSYIQLEYEYALEKKKPLFAAVITEKCIEAKVKSAGVDAIERENGHLLKPFRAIVTDRISRFFDDPKDVKIIVFESLGRFVQYDNLPGWFRGNELIDARVTLEEMSRLQSENTALTQQLNELKAVAETEQSPADTLSESAKALLLAAANKDGRFMFIHYMGGAQLGVSGGLNFLANDTPREDARWRAVIEELLQHELVQKVGTKGEMFELTYRGYEVAEEIAKRPKAASPEAAPAQ